LTYGGIIPEGHDDLELLGSGSSAFVQAKSRRDGLGNFPAGQAAGFVKELWDRYEAAEAKPGKLILLLERPVTGLPAGAELHDKALAARDAVGIKLESDCRASSLLQKAYIHVLSSPLEDAVAALAEHLRCPPLIALIHYGNLRRRIGELADDNGVRDTGSFAMLSLPDMQNEIDALSGAISPDNMEQALRDGLCEAVDFLTPLDDPLFFLGVNVQPGHLAAGLVAERPQARVKVMDTIEARRIVLIAGPSGSGKSALMWEAARAIRHAVRWFRIRRLAAEHVPLLMRLAHALRASSHAPVGFVFDDVGRGLASGWDALAQEASLRPGIIMLGSIREEDLFLISERAQGEEIRETGEDELAERLWSELRQRNQTAWPGWREPWQQSRGLLLEYAHLLTQGERLTHLLRDQVARRLREQRDLELDIVRITSAASSAGGTVMIDRLQNELGAMPGDVSRALQRLLDEHLVRETVPGQIGGLHQLRSAELFRLCHEMPPPMPNQTLARAAHCLADEDLEAFIVRTLEAVPDAEQVLIDALVNRLTAEPNARIAASILRGLSQNYVIRTVRNWLPELDRLNVPPTQATIAAMFAVSGAELSNIEQSRDIQAAAERLQPAVRVDPRANFIRRLPEQTLSILIYDTVDAVTLEELLSSLVGGQVPPEVHARLESFNPEFSGTNIVIVAKLLATVGLVDRDIAIRWVTQAGQETLFRRLEAEIPWISSIELRHESEGLAVCGDVRYVAPSVQPDLHGDVVKLCELMLAIAPSAELAIARGVTADHELAGIGDVSMADKRIPRSNLPAEALPLWNRRWITAVAYEVGAPSHTDYLVRGYEALKTLVPALERCFDTWLRGRPPHQRQLDQIGEIHDASQRLTPPRSALLMMGSLQDENIPVTPLQHVLFAASADLLRRFASLPGDYAAYLMWTAELLEQLDKAKEESWELIGGPPTELFEQLRQLIERVRLLAGEAGVRNVKPQQRWARRAKAARSGNALRLISVDAQAGMSRRFKEVQAEVENACAAAGLQASVHVRLDRKQALPWPPAEVLVIIFHNDIASLQELMLSAADRLREATGDGRSLILVPSLDGYVISHMTFTGVSTLLPMPYEADDWLRSEGYEILDDFCARTFGEIIDALSEISGIRQFGYGAEDRPVIERTSLTNNEERLQNALSLLRENLANTAAADILERIERLAEDVLGQQIPLASDLAGLMHGQFSPVCDEIRVFNLQMLYCDLMLHS
jgi:hypothetical protein